MPPRVITQGVSNALIWLGVAAWVAFNAFRNPTTVEFVALALAGLVAGHVLSALAGVRFWVRSD